MSSESCTSFPIIDNVDTIMLENKGSTNQLKKSERRKAGKKGVDDFDHTLNGTVFTLLQKSNYLVDVSLKSRVDEIVIRNLSPNATFSFELCSRLKHVNGEEWQAWSERETFQTLYPLYISQKYFHEGCVELFWNRFCNDELHVQLVTLNERLSELRSSLKGVTLYNIEEKRDALTEEEYSRYKTYIDELSAVEAESASCKEALMAQFKGVLVHPDTPIKGYHLRAVHESGTFTDVYIRNEKNVFTTR
ncbi:hypothetical protein AGDE_15105 [Angomonas deanei]|uniref:Uncharacterized protein n=1 Tax=Angomonas deanei TaxID=59799 RepID=A0A7G2CSY7_9TRYP|nr:hypothetical protein AGDE_15105 [Angomonas deanei]CAD2221332.1 hypothetical protein, conserved [Angomonas deanei]|eukprot:EPY19682.1 hypothetical protein AGDE_15105 [Angomonas deanei]